MKHKTSRIVFLAISGISLLLAHPQSKASAVIDFDTNLVYRINDSLPILLVKSKGKYVSVEDFNQTNPAGARGKSGYATERQIDGENILNQNKGVKNAIITPWFTAGSLDTNKYEAKKMIDYVRYSGISRNILSGNAQKALRNFQIVKKEFEHKNASKTRALGGPNKRGHFSFK